MVPLVRLRSGCIGGLAVWLSCAALAQVASAPAPLPARPIEYRSVAAALAALSSRDGDGTIVTQSEGWTTINEPLAAAQWSFVPAAHEAYPAVVRRIMKRSSAGASVETSSLCEAPREACARLLAEFEAANQRLTQGARARARQGSTPPR